AHLNRPVLWQRIDLASNRSFYFVCVVFLAISILAAYSLRRFRTGRVLIALRDNQRGASVYGVSPVRAKLAAFAISGGMAGMAGVLLAYSEYNVIPGSYDPIFSVFIFLAVVIGGVSSIPGAVIGVVALRAGALFIPEAAKGMSQQVIEVLPLLLTGPLLITSVLSYPAGMAEIGCKVRDAFLRRVADRHGILVPSLIADKRTVATDDDREVVEHAEEGFAEADLTAAASMEGATT
ncbi:MAG TPA: branched-chain amino acid ABC transporter permease, partial [Acidimicrobiales bacterium]|nr:branched-chain amino acid ABC transporter permease [Acidimicrobiales bacterium]